MLEGRDGLGVPNMFLAGDPEGVVAANVEGLGGVGLLAECVLVAAHRLCGDFVKADAFDHRGGAGEVVVDELRVEADGIEDLRTAVGLERRDAHLGHHLQHALLDGFDVGIAGLGRCRSAGDLIYERLDRVDREVGVDRLCAVSTEETEVMHLPRLAGLDDEANLCAEAFADQVVVDRRRCEERGDGDAVDSLATIRQDQDVAPVLHGLGGAGAESFECRANTFDAFVGRVADAELAGPERVVDVVLDPPHPFEAHIREDRVVHLESLLRSAHVEVQQVRPRPDEGHERHHRLLANRVDRRIRDLGEALLEVVGEELGAVGQHGGRCVAAHRPDRVLALGRHRLEEELDVLLGVAEGLLGIAERLGVRLHRRDLGRQVDDVDLGLVQPLLVRLGARQASP